MLQHLIDTTPDPISVPPSLLVKELHRRLEQLLAGLTPVGKYQGELVYDMRDVIRLLGIPVDELIKTLDDRLAEDEPETP